ncbi:MAG: exodeoxyribonuclease V subunit gamma [Elusimicrobia bacterium]|nr:exodeoxyribonuclease V subunit gamma [Elusimicrobiota bacterium]
MPLSLVCGPYGFLEKAFVSHLTARPPGPARRVGVVTTSQRMAERLQRLLALERGLAFFNLRFHTLHSLSLDLLRASGAILPAVNNDDLFHERLVETLLIESGGWEPDRARALAGAHRATLRDLVEAGVETASFREHFGDMEIPGEGKLYRFLNLADRYRERLASLNVAGSADLGRMATVAVEGHPEILAGFDELLYYGFYDLNGAQSDFLSAVAGPGRVTLFFPCVKGHAGWKFAERFLDLKISVGVGGSRYETAIGEGPLGDALGGLFDPGSPPVQAGENVRIIDVSGERDELWQVAKEILQLRERRSPLEWEDIGVVARGLDAYAELIPEIFGAHGIPYSISEGGPLLSHPAARLALDLMEISGRGHERDALLDVIGSPCLQDEVFAGPSRSEARAYLLQGGPRAGLAHLLEGSPMGREENPDPLRPALPPQALKDFAVRVSAETEERIFPWVEHARRARRRMERLIVKNPETVPVLDQMEAILERLEELDRFSPPVDDAEFSETFVEALRRARRPGTGPAQGVRVLGAMEARGESFGALFLVGLKEGVFPRVVREDPLLGDDLRRILRDPGGYWILPKLEGYDEEKLLFTLLVSSAREKLYLLYSRSREDGRAEVPSLYLRELARAAGMSLDEAERLPRPPLEKWNAVPRGLLTVQEAGLADLLEARPLSGEWGRIVQRAAKISAWAGPTGVDGLVGRPEAYLSRRASRGLSPSALETLGDCPFEFFLSRLVGLRDPRATWDGESVSPFFVGTLQHAILQRVYAGFLSQDLPAPEEAVVRVRAETRALFSSSGDPSGGPYPLLWEALQNTVERQLVSFVDRDLARLKAEGFRPEKLEWGLQAPMGNGEFLWSGRLDRVDWNPVSRRYFVVDYKNRIRDKSLEERVLEGHVHQAPAYLELLEAQRTWGPETRAAGVRFEYLATNETEEFSEAVWREKRGEIEVRQRALLSTLTNGRFLIRPSDGPAGHCRFCDFARACRKAHGPTRKRCEGDVGSETPADLAPAGKEDLP